MSVSKSGGPRPLAAWWETARLYRDGVRVGRRGRMAGSARDTAWLYAHRTRELRQGRRSLARSCLSSLLPRGELARLGTLGVL